jgi:hypothetical protein
VGFWAWWNSVCEFVCGYDHCHGMAVLVVKGFWSLWDSITVALVLLLRGFRPDGIVFMTMLSSMGCFVHVFL